MGFNSIARRVSYITFATLFITTPVFAQHAPPAGGATGLREMTPEEEAKLSKRKIKKVRPNALGLERANAQRREQGLPELPSKPDGAEFDIDDGSMGATASTGGDGVAAAASVAAVDNSLLPSFPAIGSQGSLPSCTTWATTYYMMSHEVCLALGCDNKVSPVKVFSPKWTYNMINGGAAAGTYFSDAFSLIQNHGAALLSELPYSTSDYRSWDLNSEHWRTAISSRMSAMSSMSINSDAGMANLKQTLANGHVAVIGTYINSWSYRTVQNNPNAPNNPAIGKNIVAYQAGTAGAHAMTVVGYDDTIWTDINSNGAVDAAEVGAFKIANSWGAGWGGNGGFVWVSYDALRVTSAVPGFAPAGRNQLAFTSGAMLQTHTPYQPRVLAKVTLSHALRNQMGLQFGTSSTTQTTPQAYWNPFALNRKGGAYGFDGGTAEVVGTFYFDISSIAGGDQRIYLLYSDSTAGAALTVHSFETVDAVTRATISSSAQVPVSADATSRQLIIGNYTPDLQAPTVPGNVNSSLSTTTTTKRGKNGGTTTSTKVNVSWSASSDNVAVSKYIVYRNGVKYMETTSLSLSDGSTVAGSSYQYSISAVDSSGNESAKSAVTTVSR